MRKNAGLDGAVEGERRGLESGAGMKSEETEESSHTGG